MIEGEQIAVREALLQAQNEMLEINQAWAKLSRFMPPAAPVMKLLREEMQNRFIEMQACRVKLEELIHDSLDAHNA